MAPGGGRSREQRLARIRWKIVATSFLILAVGSLVGNSFALFLVEIPKDYGWSRSETTLAYGLYALVAALSAPLVGWAVSRYNSRWIFVFLSLLTVGGMLGCAMMTSVVQFWLFFGVLAGLGTHCFSSFALFTVIGSRVSRRAATAMSLADAGAGLALFLGLPALHWLIVVSGWRQAYVAQAVLTLIFSAALHLWLPAVRRTGGRRPASTPPAPRPRFWRRWPLLLMAAAFISGPAAYQALQTQQIALLQGSGVDPTTAVWVASTIGLTVFVWRVVSGWLCDRLGARVMMAIAGAAAAISLGALGLFMGSGVNGLLVIYPIGFAVGFGSYAMLLAMGLRGIVSPAEFPPTFGIMRTAFSIGAFVGPTSAAGIYDATHSYSAAVVVVALFAVVHFAGFHFATRNNQPLASSPTLQA